MNINAKNTEDDAGDGAFFIGGVAFSTICKINKSVGYILGVEVAWGNLLMDVMGGSAIKAIGVHIGAVWVSR